jgi:hypothetical protein
MFQLGLNFFGLSLETAPQTRKNLFKQIHEIVFHGKGGYDWETVYHMPIWLRNFTFHELKSFYDKEAQEYEKASKGKDTTTIIDSQGNVNVPEFMRSAKKPTYSTSMKK